MRGRKWGRVVVVRGEGKRCNCSIHRHTLPALPLRVVQPAKFSQVFTCSDAPLDFERGAARCVYLSSLFPLRRARETFLPIRSVRRGLQAQLPSQALAHALIFRVRLSHSQNIRGFCAHRSRARSFYPSGLLSRCLPECVRFATVRVCSLRSDSRCRSGGGYVLPCRVRIEDKTNLYPFSFLFLVNAFFFLSRYIFRQVFVFFVEGT